MTRLFDETLVETHDLYHLRYGRGAVIVAIQRGDGNESDPDRASWHKYVAGLYNDRQVGGFSSTPTFEPILSVKEDGGVARIVVQFEHRNQRVPSYDPISATIERVIPLDQVTLEIVRTAERPNRDSGKTRSKRFS